MWSYSNHFWPKKRVETEEHWFSGRMWSYSNHFLPKKRVETEEHWFLGRMWSFCRHFLPENRRASRVGDGWEAMSGVDETSGSPLGAVVGDDGVARCTWAATDPLLRAYHDDEWGRPVRGEQALFERISLEAFQAGLSWRTILAKRPAFRAAFDGFDPDVVATYSDDRLEALMHDAGIIRNRAKIQAARSNAHAVIALREHGGLDEFLWSRRPGPLPAPVTVADARATSPESIALAKDLRKVGIRFIGPTSAYALMEATGMQNTHFAGCHVRDD